MLTISSEVKELYPAISFGAMTGRKINTIFERCCLDRLVISEIELLKMKHKGYERNSMIKAAPLCHYVSYFKNFKKTYPVLLQLESVLLKNKNLPQVGAAIECMFLAEIKNLLLTAGHDVDKIYGALTIKIATGTETYQGISGKDLNVTKNDLYLSDEVGILSSMLGGPDYRTRITGQTQNALYFVYGAPGVTDNQLHVHLKTIHDYLLAVVPNSEIDLIQVFSETLSL